MNEAADGFGVRSLRERSTAGCVLQKDSRLPQKREVSLCARLYIRRKDADDEAQGFFRVAGKRRFESDEDDCRSRKAVNAAVGNPAALAQVGRTELLALKNGLKGFIVRNAVGGFEKQGALFKKPLAARDVDVKPYGFQCEMFGEQIFLFINF